MAINNYTNSVPLGQEGTGAAQIFGPSRAMQFFLNKNQSEQERLLRDQQQYQQRQQKYGEAFQQDLMKLGDLAVSPMYQGELAQLTDSLLKQGAQLRAQKINPYNPNPSPQASEAIKQWQTQLNEVKTAKLMADMLYNQQKELVKKYNADPDSFDEDEYMKIKEFEKNNSLENVLRNKISMPDLAKKLNIDKEAVKQFGEVFRQGNMYDAATNTWREFKEADIPRIEALTNNYFMPGSAADQEVNRRLRKQFGKEANTSGLLGVTDPVRVREIIDSELRNDTTEFNPMVQLLGKKIPSFDSPEYEKFLDTSVREQLAAEKVMDDAKQSMANTLIGKVNTKETRKFDFSPQKERDRRQAFITSERNKAATYEKSLLSIDKLKMDIDEKKSNGDLASKISDVTIMTDNKTPIVLSGATSGSTTEFEYNPTKDSYNVNEQKADMNKREKAKLMGVGVVAIDKNTGVVYPGDPRNYIGNPNAKFEARAQVRARTKKGSREVTTDYLEDPSVISNSLAGENKKFAQGSISVANEVLKQYNQEHSAATKATQGSTNTTNKSIADRMREAAQGK